MIRKLGKNFSTSENFRDWFKISIVNSEHVFLLGGPDVVPDFVTQSWSVLSCFKILKKASVSEILFDKVKDLQ